MGGLRHHPPFGFAIVRLAVAFKIGVRPHGASWLQVNGVSLLCGIGFTMSLFIGGLAFSDARAIDAVKIGVLGGSITSAIAGYLAPRRAPGGIGVHRNS